MVSCSSCGAQYKVEHGEEKWGAALRCFLLASSPPFYCKQLPGVLCSADPTPQRMLFSSKGALALHFDDQRIQMNMRATVLYDMILLVTGTMAFVGRNFFILKPEINFAPRCIFRDFKILNFILTTHNELLENGGTLAVKQRVMNYLPRIEREWIGGTRLPPYPGGLRIIWAAAQSVDQLWFVASQELRIGPTFPPAQCNAVCGNVRAFSAAKRGPMCQCQQARGCIGSRKLENCKNWEIGGVVAGQQECYNSCPPSNCQYFIDESS